MNIAPTRSVTVNGPVRVLHVVGPMGRGGIETWLMHLLRRLDRREVAFDFLVDAKGPAAYDDEILALGARIIRCPRERNLLSYGQRLRRALVEAGSVDVVHSHADLFSGFVLAIAAGHGVEGRIAHSHIDMRLVGRRSDPLRRGYYAFLRHLLKRNMTHGIAVSRGAASDLFGTGYAADPKVQVIPCGIDYAPFRSMPGSQSVRSEFGIPVDAKVVGHVGRFDPQKNHAFLVDAFAVAAHADRRLHLLMVGGGALQPDIVARVRAIGLQDRVTFAGVQSDVPKLLAAMDAFVFPSKYEGLGLVLIEAQAAGLPIVVSDCIPDDALLAGHRITLLAPERPEDWAASMAAAVDVPGEQRVKTVSQRFDVEWNLQALKRVYRAASGRVQSNSNNTERYGT